jgi:hypothetical protein
MLTVAIKGRKQLAVHITESHFQKLEQIKEEKNLSNAKIIEMLIEHYVNTSTNIQPEPEPQTANINTSANINIIDEESILAKLQGGLEERINNIVHRKLVEIGAIYEDEDEDCYVAPVISDEDRYRDELARIDEMNRVLSPEEVRAIIDGMDE